MDATSTLLARARSMLGHGFLYWAGAGGVSPLAPDCSTPLAVGRAWPRLPREEQLRLLPLADAAGIDVHDPTLVRDACDCSGYVCWALGIPRRRPSGGWRNTDTIWADANGAQREFERRAQARPGCLLVYPQQDSGERFGHIGIVTQVDAQGRALRVLHCSADNFLGARPGDAVRETAPEPFERQALTVCCAWRG